MSTYKRRRGKTHKGGQHNNKPINNKPNHKPNHNKPNNKNKVKPRNNFSHLLKHLNNLEGKQIIKYNKVNRTFKTLSKAPTRGRSLTRRQQAAPGGLRPYNHI